MKMRRLFQLFGSLILLGVPLRAQTTVRVSVRSDGTQGDSSSYSPAVSSDGRFVAFTSTASNLVPSDLNGFADVFVLDRITGTIEPISVDSNEVEGDFYSGSPSISKEGRWVAFESAAANLVAGDTNGVQDVFLRDRLNGTTTRMSVGASQANGPSMAPCLAGSTVVAFLSNATNLVASDSNGSLADVYLRAGTTTSLVSVDSNGVQGNGACSFVSSSQNGRWILFSSAATNLVPGDTNGMDDLFLRDLQLNTTERISVSTSSVQGNGPSRGGRISQDGRYVAFWSDADNLVPGDTNGSTDVFLRDRQAGTTERLSVSTTGAQGNQASDVCSISGDGRYVAFTSYSTNLAPGDSNGASDVYLRDRQAGTTRRISVSTAGGQANGVSGSPAITTDGRLVAFWSVATNLVPGDTNGMDDVFLHTEDPQHGTIWKTERVSVDSNGIGGDGESEYPSISSDGRYVAFTSAATNLVPNDTNGTYDVFVRDRKAGLTERVSVGAGGAQAAGGSSAMYRGSISGDGRYVVFVSSAANLVPGDTNSKEDVFLRDRLSGVTERVSVDSSGNQANGDSGWGCISPDGRYVAYSSNASNLVPGDTGMTDIFVRDRQLGTTEKVSVDSSGISGNGPSTSPSLSPDGRFIVFDSDATNLVAGDTNGWTDVFLHDRQTGLTERVSVGASGLQGNNMSFGGMPSADGRWVAFSTYAGFNLSTSGSNVFIRDRSTGTLQIVNSPNDSGYSLNDSITPDGRWVTFNATNNYDRSDANLFADIFVQDRQTGIYEMQSFGAQGESGDGHSYWSVISADGTCVAFTTEATNLSPGDTNGVLDVYVHERYGPPMFTSFCDAGVGGVRTCACSNPPSMIGRGCNNSAATGGAALSAIGSSHLSSDSVVFTTSGEKPTATSVVWQGTATVTGVVFGQGVRCVGGSLKRLYMKNAVGGSVDAPNFGAGDPTVSARSATLGSPIAPGSTRCYFVTYRDPVVLGGCPSGSTFNVTQAGAVTWFP